jgi:uncharacterized membrane protein
MKSRDKAVKVDKELMEKIENLIEKNKFLYTTKKQVINLAIIEFLKSKSLDKKKKRGKRRRKY